MLAQLAPAGAQQFGQRTLVETIVESVKEEQITDVSDVRNESGREAIRDIEKSVRKTEKQAMKGLDKKEQKTLSKLLWRIESNLSDQAPGEMEDEFETED